MKTWQVVLLLGGLGLVAVVVIMGASRPKATPINSSFAAPGSTNGLASLLGSFAGAALSNAGANKPSQTTVVVPNEGTYQVNQTNVVERGNELVDTSTGKTLVYGTD